ncbi:MAG: hypothetical protein JW827_07140 [Spirochaetes bacterium]|nr:hypothetical protein [Spirochaetota bacterium]
MKGSKISLFILIIASISLYSLPLYSQATIDTVVGSGQVGYNGDGILASQAKLYSPMAVCVDDAGNIYVADSQNNRIRKVDVMGVIMTIAGNGVFGSMGDERRAVEAALAFPMGVCVETVDKANNKFRIYIADTRNNRIRMINEFGIIRTIAGSGRFGGSGDNGPAIKADLAWPSSVALDNAGNVYVADTQNNRVRLIFNPNNKPGAGSIGSAPHIKNPKPGYIYTIAGTDFGGYGGDGEMAIIANLNQPWDVYPSNGDVYISDKNNHIIRKVDKTGKISTIAGLPAIPGYYGDVLKATEEKLHTPYGLWTDGKTVYVADAMNSRIRSIDPAANKISTYAGIGIFGFAGDGAPALNCIMSHPIDIFGDGKGNFYISDLENAVIRLIKTGGSSGGTRTTQ